MNDAIAFVSWDAALRILDCDLPNLSDFIELRAIRCGVLVAGWRGIALPIDANGRLKPLDYSEGGIARAEDINNKDPDGSMYTYYSKDRLQTYRVKGAVPLGLWLLTSSDAMCALAGEATIKRLLPVNGEQLHKLHPEQFPLNHFLFVLLDPHLVLRNQLLFSTVDMDALSSIESRLARISQTYRAICKQILATIESLRFPPLAIPRNGKQHIENAVCNQSGPTPDSFRKAWEAGVKARLFDTARRKP